MAFFEGVLLVVTGLATMGFGLFLFYALLPLLYFFFGFGVGHELSLLITSTPPGEIGLMNLIFAFGGGILFAAGAYFLEPFRRILIGVGLWSLLGGLIATALGLTGFLGVAIMFVAAVIGGTLTLRVFDAFIIVASALGGTGLAMDGAHQIFPSLIFFDRAVIVSGAVTPAIIWIVLSAIAMVWQFKHIERWKGKPG
jgi:hypothetical protein